MKTLRKALAILRHLASAQAPLGVTELSVATGLDKAIVHRALRTMVDEGLVMQEPVTRKYRMGAGLLHMAGLQLSRLRVRDVAEPHLFHLWNETDETIHLVIRHDLESSLAQVHESRRGVRVSSRLGERAPLHCTAGGKVFLAFGPQSLLEDMILKGLAGRQANTITDAEQLRTEIEAIRARGYATDVEESDPDYTAIAAPVFDHTQNCIAAVAAAVPLRRYRAANPENLVPLLLECTRAISEFLGAETT